MKEIGYRAWLKDEKKMVEVKSIHFGTKKIIYGYSENSHSYGNVSCKFDDCELMQYTGREDKNGKKIFDGDIMQLCNGTYPCLVYWDGKGWAWLMNGKRREIDLTREKMQIIGNIHDNPELLQA